MKLTVVGCAGSFPGPDSPASCYLLEAPFEGRIFRLVMELGNGALGGLQRLIDPRQIDAVALSHLHPDHCLDMCGLYVFRKYHPDGSCHQVPIYGPSDAADYLTGAYGNDEASDMCEQFRFRTWTEGTVSIGPFEVTVKKVVHPVDAYAIRIEHDGRTLVYSGDTGRTEELIDFVSGADTFLCEASFVESVDNPPGLHLTGADAGHYATAGKVGRLLLTHIPAWTDRNEVLRDAKGTWVGLTELVTAGADYDI